MKVLFVTSEAFPLLKTGGLGDVAGALPVALSGLGVDVRILMPGYPDAMKRACDKGEPIDLGDPLDAGAARLVPARMPDSRLPVWLIDCPALYDRPGGPYTQADGTDWPDNHLRFALLGRVAAMLCMAGSFIGWRPDVVHGHDWQTGLTPAYLMQWGGPRTPSVFTVHNLHYSGLFDASVLPAAGLRQDAFTIHGLEFHGKVSFLKAGLVYSDALTTVSPTYAREIQTPAFGRGLDGLLSARARDLHGILNGIDDTIWNPHTDGALAARYNAAAPAGKARCKAALQRELGLTEDLATPVLAVISRFTEQKGIDFALEALPRLRRDGAQVVMLGEGDGAIERAVAAAAHPGQVAVRISHDEGLAHRIIAGADILLMPSRFEPCGLTQMYALRYGTIPVVHRTGGLADTVRDVSSGLGNGFVFDDANAAALSAAAERAITTYRDRAAWAELCRRGMEMDFGWRRSASEYIGVYERLAGTRKRGADVMTMRKDAGDESIHQW